ncbi:hypothetical protein EKO04_007295 [Ascochyta lentis]|uniref:Uncharacterized protein n=1 Tax=Ascochyta lentis TaxID=205686 RepID=A0A8H7MH98_9PLEO|nr:hypothetical protein EKO04_007295 [Ascochyta lentis]
MEPKDNDTAKNFRRYARKEFPDEFARFRNFYRCDFEEKTYLDENHAAHNVSVLLVGHYHTRKAGPPVWAQATSTCVRYYQGKAGAPVCTPIPEEHVTRIYYSAPYSTMVGAQTGRSRPTDRKAEHYFAETIVNVFFLFAGRLEQVSNPGKTDMLSNFRYACMNTTTKPDIQELVNSTVLQQPEPLPADDAVKRESKKRKRSSHDHGQRIKQEDDIDIVAGNPTYHPDPPSQSQDRLVQHLSSHSPTPYSVARDTPQISLLDQLRNYEADMTFKLEQEKRARCDEVQALRAKLYEQELKTQAAEEKLFREKKKRKRAEEQVEGLRSQKEALEERSASPEVECVGPKWHTCKAMIAGQKKEINRTRQAILTRNETISKLRKALAKEH